jgi:hypothetical protein
MTIGGIPDTDCVIKTFTAADDLLAIGTERRSCDLARMSIYGSDFLAAGRGPDSDRLIARTDDAFAVWAEADAPNRVGMTLESQEQFTRRGVPYSD